MSQITSRFTGEAWWEMVSWGLVRQITQRGQGGWFTGPSAGLQPDAITYKSTAFGFTQAVIAMVPWSAKREQAIDSSELSFF